MGTKTLILTLALGLSSLTALAKDKVIPLYVTGTLTVSAPETVSVSEGTYSLAYNENCPFLGFGSCKNYKFLFVSPKETLSISLPGRTVDFYHISNFQDADPERKLPPVYNSEKSLRLDLSVSLSQVTKEYEYTVVPQVCKEVCVSSERLCSDYEIAFNKCDVPYNQRYVCHRYETQCTPSYEVCLLKTKADASLKIDIFDVLASKPAAKFFSETRKMEKSEKVPMPNCFQR